MGELIGYGDAVRKKMPYYITFHNFCDMTENCISMLYVQTSKINCHLVWVIWEDISNFSVASQTQFPPRHVFSFQIFCNLGTHL